jgi:membrane fusion protein (multidrug efflux system)
MCRSRPSTWRRTQSSQAVNIQARVSGFLDKRVYTEGSVVKTGQVLFQMDQKPFQAQVDGAQAALQRQQAAMEVAKQNLARTKPLAQQNALSQKDLDDAQGQFEQTAAAVEQAKSQLVTAQLNLSYTTIRSPVDGVSSYAAVADGTYLNPQNAQLTTVSVLTPMWINFSVSENEMERIRNDVRSGLLKLPDGGKFVVEVEMVDGNLFRIRDRSRLPIRRTTRRRARSCSAPRSTIRQACCARTSTCACG